VIVLIGSAPSAIAMLAAPRHCRDPLTALEHTDFADRIAQQQLLGVAKKVAGMVRHHASGLVSMVLSGHDDGCQSRRRSGLSAVEWPVAFRLLLGLPPGFAACTVLLA
jgi:hypothetical protein